ncbi:hypothetical protein J6590_010793 [Homalodisca vitripennis]|nr:hypothetical protein J6590_010793 [Homalodisca vitripennis]
MFAQLVYRFRMRLQRQNSNLDSGSVAVPNVCDKLVTSEPGGDKFAHARCVAGTVEVHFENKDGGFFLKHTPRQHYPAVADLSGLGGKESPSDGSTLLSIDRFTVFQTSQPMSVRATYGPFSTKQTVPARYIVPDPMPMNASSLSLDMDLSGGHHLDMSAHVVRPEIPRDSPVLRVLFHTGADPRLPRHQQQVCILVHAVMGDRPALTAACSPDGEDGVCLAEITVPASWWAPLPLPDASGRPGKPVKTPQRSVKVSYSVLEPRGSDLAECLPRVQIQPVTPLASVPLTHARSQYREVRTDDMLIMMLPHSALFPRSRIHVPVFLQAKPGFPVSGFILSYQQVWSDSPGTKIQFASPPPYTKGYNLSFLTERSRVLIP